MVYTDGIHVTADTVDELYKYANTLNLDPDLIILIGRNIYSHFIIAGDVTELVLKDIRVRRVTCREIVKLCQLNFRLPETNDQLREWEHHHKKFLSDLQTPSEAKYEKMLSNIFKRANYTK